MQGVRIILVHITAYVRQVSITMEDFAKVGTLLLILCGCGYMYVQCMWGVWVCGGRELILSMHGYVVQVLSFMKCGFRYRSC